MPGAFSGRLFDGRSAEGRAVALDLATDGLRISDDQGTLITNWPYASLWLVDRPYPERPVRLTSDAQPEARLTVLEHDILEPLRHHTPRLHKRRPGSPEARRRLLSWAAAITVGAAGTVVALTQLAGELAALVPLEWEVALGHQVVAEVTAETEACTARAGRDALDRLSGRLTAVIQSPYDFTIRVVDAEQVNAFAAPGGQIVVLRGLIQEATSPDEVAGVLAHEMGHVVLRHPTEALFRQMGFFVVLGSLMSSESDVGEWLTGAGTMLLALSYSREAEAEADAMAVEILAAAGVRSDGFQRFFDRLASKEPGRGAPGVLGYLSTHPPSEDRSEAIARAGVSGAGWPITELEWEALRRICGG